MYLLFHSLKTIASSKLLDFKEFYLIHPTHTHVLQARGHSREHDQRTLRSSVGLTDTLHRAK